MDTSGLPQLQIAAIFPDRLDILSGPPSVVPKAPFRGASIDYSADGKIFALCGGKAVDLYGSDSLEKVRSLPGDEAVGFLSFSPAGKYITTYERPNKELGNSHRNLKVYDAMTGSVVATFHKKGITREKWPAVQFAASDSRLFHMITNAVNVHEVESKFEKAVRKVELKGVTNFSVCPGSRKVVACYVPESKSSPAGVQIMDWEEGGSTLLSRKSFFRSQECGFKWNTQGTCLLIQSFCDYDATNSSYYGESKLYYMTADGRKDLTVPLDKDGSVNDAQWNPDGKSFVVVYGTMPANATLFDDQCNPLYKLGSGPWNTVRWNPQGRFLMLGGFGSLPGDMQFFDKKADNTCKKMGGCRSACSVTCEWSPCGRYVMTAVTAPRMRVDNRLSIYTYYGELVHEQPHDVLHGAQWRPAAVGAYPDRPQSPERLQQVAESRKKGVDITEAQKATAYVPVHLRQRGVKGEATTSLGFDAEVAAGRIKNMMASKVRVPEGAEHLVVGGGNTKNASKNAKKRANKSKDKGEEDVEAGVSSVSLADPPAAAEAVAPQDAQKRLRNLRKKLTKIEGSKEKQARGESLEPEQLAGLAGEEELRAEMRSLGATDV